MRKKEREITQRTEIDAILAGSPVCRIAFAVAGEPYLVPLSHGYDADANALYVHTAVEGRKIACIEANPRVCFEVEGEVSVKEGDERGCTWGLRYESVIGYGVVRQVLDNDARDAALHHIMRQHAGRDGEWSFDPKVLSVTAVWALEISSMTGKRSV